MSNNTNKIPSDYDPDKSLDDLFEIFKNQAVTASEQLKQMEKIRNFIHKLYHQGFVDGLDAGTALTEE